MLLATSVASLFKWRQFDPEVILLAVGWYLRFSLSYRDVEELLAERGLLVDPSPSGGGFNAPELNRRVRKRQSRKTVALGRIEVAFYAMTQKIYTYCDEPATTVGYLSFHNLRDIYLFTMKMMFYILWYAPGWEDVTTQYIGGDALSCYRSVPSGERCRGDREAAGFTLGQCITLAHKMAAGWTEGS